MSASRGEGERGPKNNGLRGIRMSESTSSSRELVEAQRALTEPPVWVGRARQVAIGAGGTYVVDAPHFTHLRSAEPSALASAKMRPWHGGGHAGLVSFR
jgi:hypothetical protein